MNRVKQILALVLMLILLTGACACAVAESADAASFFELDPDGNVLTVRLAANETTGYQWEFQSSDEQLLELITSEYVPDPVEEGITGSGGVWAASFKSALTSEGQGGRVRLTLVCRQPWAPETVEPAEGRLLDIWVFESGQLQVDGVWTLQNLAPSGE